MAISKIVQNSIDETSVSLGVKITNVQVANSSYTVLDDTAVNVGGGYIVITGAGFKESAQVLVGQNTACSVTIIDSTTIRAEVPAKDAGTYPIYVVNTDGAVGIRVPGLTYSGFPTWVTDSTLPDQGIDEAISIQLEATGANTYALQTGSTLPSGMVLNTANGLLTGTVTGVEDDTLYNFTIEAIDTENQESPRAFNVTITVGDEYFNQTVLLLNGDGTSGANNNVFRDSSDNDFAITRNGNATQGTFTPFSLPDGRWSNYLDNSGDYLQISSNAAFSFGTSDFTIECWFNASTLNAAASGQDGIITMLGSVGLYVASDAVIVTHANVATLNNFLASLTENTWYHLALTRSGTDMKAFINGVQTGTTFTNSTNFSNNGNVRIGTETSQYFHGHISNLRVIKGTALYTSNFTPPTGPLTAVSGTSLLTCQSNRFKDNSTNNFTLTPSGDVKVTPFSPFAPNAIYSAATHGGSAYFDGSGDYLSIASDTSLQLSSSDFAVEFFLYLPVVFPGDYKVIIGKGYNNQNTQEWYLEGMAAGYINLFYSTTGTGAYTQLTITPALKLGQWYHIALVRDGNTLSCFVDGTRTYNNNSFTATLYSGNGPAQIGGYNDGGTTLYTNCYMSSVRIVKGSSVYDPTQSTITVPTTPLTNITNTSLLTNFTNAGILDYTAKNVIETVGGVNISNSQSKFGGSSLYVNGASGSRFEVKRNPTIDLYGDFTVEGWFYAETLPAGSFKRLWSFGTFDEVNSFDVEFNVNPGPAFLRININGINDGANASDSATGLISANNWYHVAVTRSSGTVKAWLDGTNVITLNTSVTAAINKAQNVYIGSLHGYETTVNAIWNGYIDDFRVSQFARYTNTFTPPTSAFRKR